MVTRTPSHPLRAIRSAVDRLFRADMRRSPFYGALATLLIAWILGSLALALGTPLFEYRGLRVSPWARWLTYAAALTLVVLARRRQRRSR